MRIALFTDTFLPKVDGIVTTLRQTVSQLNKLGNEVLIFAPEGGVTEYEQSRVMGIPGWSCPFYPELTLSPPRSSIREALTAFQPDIIHVADPALLGLAALYYGGGAQGGAIGLPLVISYHTDLPQYLHHYGMGMLEGMIWPLLRVRHKRATLNLCTSAFILKQLREHGIERIALWPGAVDSELYNPIRRSERMRLRLCQGHAANPLLLYVGRLSAEKEIERLKPILEGIPGARLALVGDGPHRAKLESYFSGSPVSMTGFLHGEVLASAFASSDIFVMPSRTETLGLVVLEAMSSNLPVVAARSGGIPELIENGVSGYLFDNEIEATAAIRRILRDPDLAASVRKNAREVALEHSWEAATRRLLEHYQFARDRVSFPCRHAEATRASRRSLHPKRVLGAAASAVLRKLLP